MVAGLPGGYSTFLAGSRAVKQKGAKMRLHVPRKRGEIFLSNFHLNCNFLLLAAALLLIMYGFLPSQANAADVTLGWEASTQAQVAGYKLYYRNGGSQYKSADVGNVTRYTLQELPEGSTHTFAASAYDSSGNESALSQTLTFTIPTQSESPVAYDGTLTVVEGNSATGVLIASDANGDPLTYSIVSAPSMGKVVLSNSTDGSYSYSANTNVSGTDSFTFKVNDGKVDSNTATVTVSITRVNHAPVAQDDSATTNEGQSVTINVLANDSDTDGDTLSISSVGKPHHSTVSVLGNNVIYTPVSGFTGTESFSYTITDGHGGTATAQVIVTVVGVSPVNHRPVASNGLLTVTQDSTASGMLAANDPDGDPLQYIILTNGSKGSVRLTNSNTGVYTYTPNAGATGTDTFTFKANDGQLDSNTGTVTVTISQKIVLALNAGGLDYVDADGTLYQADTWFTGGNVGTTTRAINGTNDDVLYQSERKGNFTYNLPLEDGNYLVTLKFSEYWFRDPGKRIFNVSLEGVQAISNLDLFSESGYCGVYDVQWPVTVEDGVLDIEFLSVVNNAKLSAILVERVTDEAPQPQPKEVVFALNAAGSQYVDANGTVYEPDMWFTGGSIGTTTRAINGTNDDVLYQSERKGNFTYNLPLEDGNYLVTLKFSEYWFRDPGKRIFNVSLEGVQAISNLDLFSESGYCGVYDVQLPVTVEDGVLDIEFLSVVNNAKLSAILVEK
jgi:hypothetical protein